MAPRYIILHNAFSFSIFHCMKKCQLCERNTDELEFHHFFPGKKRRLTDDGIYICRNCGDQIHLMFDNRQLRSEYHDLESLKTEMEKYIQWVKTKPVESHFCMKKKKK